MSEDKQINKNNKISSQLCILFKKIVVYLIFGLCFSLLMFDDF